MGVCVQVGRGNHGAFLCFVAAQAPPHALTPTASAPPRVCRSPQRLV